MRQEIQDALDKKEALAPPVKSIVEQGGQEDKPGEPVVWAPARVLEVCKIPGFRLKWVRDDQLVRFSAEGWQFVAQEEVPDLQKTILDGASLDSRVRMRELVLMKMSEELGLSRDKYYKDLTDGALKGSVEEFKKEANADGAKSYGEGVTVIKGGA